MNLRRQFLEHLGQTSPSPLLLEIDHGSGVFLFSPDGKSYLDLIAGISVSSLGHAHPAVIKAVKEQSERYMHTMVYGEFVLKPQVELAHLLSQNLPKELQSVYFVNSGSEATEGAMKLAKRYTGRKTIVSCKYAYHGSTQGAASLMWPRDFTAAFQPLLPNIKHITFNNFEDLELINEESACVIVETVQAESGVNSPQNNYLKALRNRCTEVGALLILDEIQVGYGRTGSLFAFEQYDIIPDILLLAKAMGGGMPLGAFIASNEIMNVLSHNPVLGHISTFGGHPVNCAAGLATLKCLLESDYIKSVKEKEALFRSLLKHPAILELRSSGLLMAIQLDSFDAVQKIISHCLQNGLITDWFLFNDSAIRIAPPLIIEEEEIRLACKILLEGLNLL